MYFKRVFRLFWQLYSQIVAPPSELIGGHRAGAPPPCIRARMQVSKQNIIIKACHAVGNHALNSFIGKVRQFYRT